MTETARYKVTFLTSIVTQRTLYHLSMNEWTFGILIPNIYNQWWTIFSPMIILWYSQNAQFLSIALRFAMNAKKHRPVFTSACVCVCLFRWFQLKLEIYCWMTDAYTINVRTLYFLWTQTHGVHAVDIGNKLSDTSQLTMQLQCATMITDLSENVAVIFINKLSHCMHSLHIIVIIVFIRFFHSLFLSFPFRFCQWQCYEQHTMARIEFFILNKYISLIFRNHFKNWTLYFVAFLLFILSFSCSIRCTWTCASPHWRWTFLHWQLKLIQNNK